MDIVLGLVGTAALVVAAWRWLRVAQREHYIAGTIVRAAARWIRCRPENALVAGAGIGTAFLAVRWHWLAYPAAAAGAVFPIGLPYRGTPRLAFTARGRRLIVALGIVVAVIGGAFELWARAPVGPAAAAVFMPAAVAAAAWLAAPLERRLLDRFVRQAAATRDRLDPTVVGVTGSYGKTSTKSFIAQLVGDLRPTLASPASYNNRAGLALTINNELHDGVEVFVAEMGTYGPGEIAELCTWVKPDIAVLTGLGPVHLERFGSLDAILRAKLELVDAVGAGPVVFNADSHELRAALDARAGTIPCSTGAPARVVAAWEARTPDGVPLRVDDRVVGQLAAASRAAAANAALAVGAGLALGFSAETLGARSRALTSPAHRLTRATTERGVTVLDDTFNSNPAGATAALEALGAEPGRRVTVTPGMVELGSAQAAANRQFGAAAAKLGTVVVVGHTNRRALVAGVQDAGGEVVRVADRAAAVAWVRAHVEPGDAVLYENDLPDHYP